MDAVQFRVRQRRPQPAQIAIAGVGQGHRATGQHGRRDPGLAQTALGHPDQVHVVLAEQRGDSLGVPADGVDVYAQFRHGWKLAPPPPPEDFRPQVNAPCPAHHKSERGEGDLSLAPSFPRS